MLAAASLLWAGETAKTLTFLDYEYLIGRKDWSRYLFARQQADQSLQLLCSFFIVKCLRAHTHMHK